MSSVGEVHVALAARGPTLTGANSFAAGAANKVLPAAKTTAPSLKAGSKGIISSPRQPSCEGVNEGVGFTGRALPAARVPKVKVGVSPTHPTSMCLRWTPCCSSCRSGHPCTYVCANKYEDSPLVRFCQMSKSMLKTSCFLEPRSELAAASPAYKAGASLSMLSWHW